MGVVFTLKSLTTRLLIATVASGALGIFLHHRWKHNTSPFVREILHLYLTPTDVTNFFLATSILTLCLCAFFGAWLISSIIAKNYIKIDRTGVYVPAFLHTEFQRIHPKKIEDFYITELKKSRFGRLTIVYDNKKKYRISASRLEHPEEINAIHKYLLTLVGSELETIQKRIADGFKRTRKINPLYYLWVLGATPFFLLSLHGFTAGFVYVPNPYDIQHIATLTGPKVYYISTAYAMFGLALFSYPCLMYYKVTKRSSHLISTVIFFLGGVLIRISYYVL